MIAPFILGNIQDLESPEATKRFIEKYASQIQIQKRHNTCNIRIKVKSYQITDTGISIDFFSKEDANLFWNNQDKTIELIFNSQE